MHDADNGPGGASTDTARRPDHDAGRIRRYVRSRRAGEVLASATMAPAYRVDRAEELGTACPPQRLLLVFARAWSLWRVLASSSRLRPGRRGCWQSPSGWRSWPPLWARARERIARSMQSGTFRPRRAFPGGTARRQAAVSRGQPDPPGLPGPQPSRLSAIRRSSSSSSARSTVSVSRTVAATRRRRTGLQEWPRRGRWMPSTPPTSPGRHRDAIPLRSLGSRARPQPPGAATTEHD